MLSQMSDTFLSQTVEAIKKVLSEDGWLYFETDLHDEFTLGNFLLSLSHELGTPVKGRAQKFVERLIPREHKDAYPSSLSHQYGFGVFPYHIDGSHWKTPPRYLILACLHPGATGVPTLLVDSRDIEFTPIQIKLAQTAVFWVRNGRDSFYTTILDSERQFIRYDPGCMEPQTPDAVDAFSFFSNHSVSHLSKEISWKCGMILIIDNWRILHARGNVGIKGGGRILLRSVTI